ncbi:ABC transporter ATP-binding protein [Streptomyces sp. NPDC051940]|uniref:ABC transporter ATP-binding protein n=1 Tax=Streptomyces sp. NPDC051940 TaxID=3155675 RepID=UPI003414B620
MSDGRTHQGDATTAHPVDALRLNDVTKTYGSGDGAVTALDRVTLSLRHGTFTAVMGPSGSGKTTLLQVAAGLDRADSGTVTVDGAELTGGTEAELTRFRRQRIGFVFQQYNLLPALTVAQNTVLPLKLARRRVDRERTRELLTRMGLGAKLDRRPDELSGGQRQRVAIARALVARPAVVFADEPTGALDTHSARDVLALLRESVHTHGQTVVMVTHDPVAASYADTVQFLADGRVAGRMRAPTADAVAERMAHLGDEYGPDSGDRGTHPMAEV